MTVPSTAPAGPPAKEIRGRKGGIDRSSTPAAEAASDFWRRGSGPEPERFCRDWSEWLMRQRRASADCSA